MLICSDLLSRGIDIPALDLVINYDAPKVAKNKFEDDEDTEREFVLDIPLYLHRIGRTGRYVRKGVAITFFFPHERELLAQLEQHLEIELRPLKSVREVNFKNIEDDI